MAKRRRSVEERFKLITRNTEEIIGEKELKDLLKRNEKLRHYIGFEISGKIHLGNGLVSMLKVRDFLKAGVDCRIFLADWHTWINDKLGGNPEVIKRVAVGYFKEGMKASMKCVGGNSKKIKFVLGTDLYHKNDLYWATVIDVCKFTTLSRIMRSITILGREEGGSVDFNLCPNAGCRYFYSEVKSSSCRNRPKKSTCYCKRCCNETFFFSSFKERRKTD